MKLNYRNINIKNEYSGERYYDKVLNVPSWEFSGKEKVILDTDVAWLNDDAIAMALCIGSKEIELLGVTVVEGNYDQNRGISEGLSMLEYMGYGEIPMWRGADRPLAHYRGRYEEMGWGTYATFQEVVYPLGRPSRLQPAPGFAAKAISDLAHRYPHEVVVFAIGPMTNVALALAADPELAGLLKGIMIMGGSIPGLPNGAGNCVPTAEFNFFVDPEAAAIVLRSGVSILLVPLNACRRVAYTRDFHDQMMKESSVGKNMLEERMQGMFEKGTNDLETANFSHYGLNDSTACVVAIRPELGVIKRMTIQIDLSHGPAYGTSYAYNMAALKQAKVKKMPGVYTGMLQSARLDGAVSDPVEIDVCVDVKEPEDIRKECLKRLSALHIKP